MNRFLPCAMVLALVVYGCNKAPNSATKGKASEAPAAPTKSDPQPASGLPVSFTPETHPLVVPEDVPLLEQINRENIKVVAATVPSIVRITAEHPVDPRMQLFGNELPFQFHLGPGAHSYPQNDPSFGSGVVISRDGYIVTNNHVIEDAKSIEVQTQDKETYGARVIAADALVDVAILKIEATDLPALPWGDSDKVEVGEQVFAIGNPFNLEDSVSKGIVSAKGRNLENSSNYEDYIQTDAAINPGNSGGALINIHGELIGINAAIASSSRVNMGVGFAIPSNLVRYAVEGLLKEGKLVRGFLGVMLPETIDEGVINQLGLKNDQGALLAGVQAGSPADLAHLRAGDFITEVDEHKIGSVADLRLVVAQLPIGKQVAIKFIRDGVAQNTQVKIEEVPASAQAGVLPGDEPDNKVLPPAPGNPAPGGGNVLSGVQVGDLNDKARSKFGIDRVVASGVVVTGVQEGSPAEAKGMTRGDVVESVCINRGSTQAVASSKDFTDLAKGLRSDQSVVLLVHHARASNFVYLAPEK